MSSTKKPSLKSVPTPGAKNPSKPTQEELEAELKESDFEVLQAYDQLVKGNQLQEKTNNYVKGVEEVWKSVVDNRTRVMANLKEGARYISKHEFYKAKKLSTPTTNLHTLEVGDAIFNTIDEATAELPTGLMPEIEGE